MSITLKTCGRLCTPSVSKYIQGIMEYFPEDTKISRPQGGFVLWVELNKKVNAYKVCNGSVEA